MRIGACFRAVMLCPFVAAPILSSTGILGKGVPPGAAFTFGTIESNLGWTTRALLCAPDCNRDILGSVLMGQVLMVELTPSHRKMVRLMP